MTRIAETPSIVPRAGSDVVELHGPALAGLGGTKLGRTPGRARLRDGRPPMVASLDLGQCEVRRLQLPAFEGWRPGPVNATHPDAAVTAVLHREGAMKFVNQDGTTHMTGSMLMIHSYYPECEFEADEASDRIAVRIPSQILPASARAVLHPYVLFEPSAPGLPAIFEKLLLSIVAEEGRLRPADRGRLQRTLASLTADLIAIGAEIGVDDRHLGLAGLRGRAIGYIEANLFAIGHVDEVAAAMRCSQRQLYKAFEPRRTTPSRYIWQRRLERARERIAIGQDATIGETAYACGFQSYAHFSRAYKRAFGIAPAETARHL